MYLQFVKNQTARSVLMHLRFNPHKCFTTKSWALSSLGKTDPDSNTNVVGSVSDPDPGGKNDPQKQKKCRFHVSFQVLDVLF
jgi:hypothetical protein